MEKKRYKGGIDLEIRVLRRNSQELKLEIEGEGHTLCNLLESVLLEDENVEFAGYDVPHPLVSNTTFFIRTKKGKKPEEALVGAIEKIRQRGKELGQEIEKALQEWEKKEKASGS
ncbi:DNA-directed RNA polymerase subunit L [Candidatus Bathyarchaeota archaeon]|nr:MAG: DNA-directed RNA polymerase subunit L [Candidatus Bathyarchaeota archaeon]